MTIPQENKTINAADEKKFSIQAELDETNRAVKEISLMLEQSRIELGKLTQRNAAVTAHLQQIQNQMGSIPPEEIKSAYDSALDAQQRMFVMRGQLEKLQSDQTHLTHYKEALERINSVSSSKNDGLAESAKMGSVEMLVNAQEAERQRLSRQMHDGPAQALSNFILQTEIAMKLLDVDPAQARNELGNLKVAAMGTFQKVRNFIFELRPMMLDDLGVVPTIKRYADTFKEQAGVDISILVSGNERRLAPYLEVMIFRSMQELLSYAVHQNQATLIKIQLDMGESVIKLSMDDNGKGFDTDTLGKEPNLGLKLIRDRSEMLGGSLAIDSSPGKGARVVLTIPANV
jgi:two-component system, NarL family, sensor histidine kinase DegS